MVANGSIGCKLGARTQAGARVRLTVTATLATMTNCINHNGNTCKSVYQLCHAIKILVLARQQYKLGDCEHVLPVSIAEIVLLHSSRLHVSEGRNICVSSVGAPMSDELS